MTEVNITEDSITEDNKTEDNKTEERLSDRQYTRQTVFHFTHFIHSTLHYGGVYSCGIPQEIP